MTADKHRYPDDSLSLDLGGDYPEEVLSEAEHLGAIADERAKVTERGLTTRQAMDVINLSDDEFNAKYGVTRCAACGSPDVFYEPGDGWSCGACHRTDADE